ncbi:tRNA (adenosine(37)-N6)-threonylcarbamoyltransferase complex ATPase subunit type 1 TsaE [Pseudokineococcus sp. 1T1Z-3]|uniref:tRNA (adenosine(37)-N6)-threonylcarbamoyltransferase complex ATPase subunit type 1 TsaE n=1 Tax=Pseudokineococcus sp. 1T1Z-3 TaxID=3132745 RepID=UPI0030A331FE
MSGPTSAHTERVVSLPSAAATAELGRQIGRAARGGDLVVLSGDLGAGKTTLTQGIGEGLGVRGPVTSPTFVIARLHPSIVGGPDLLHVDAYRLGGALELDDLDLDADLSACVVVVEWGRGLVEQLSGDRLEVDLHRSDGEAADVLGDTGEVDEKRIAVLRGVGERWANDVSLVGTSSSR